jgi:Protein of unknown function (DUF3617)
MGLYQKSSGPMRARALPWIGAALLAFLSVALAAGPRTGLWKIITRAEINGVSGPDQESTRCLTDEDVNNLEATFSPNSRTTNSSCENTEHNAAPDRVSWRLRCTGQIDMDVAGEFVFDAPEHYSATITTHTSMLGREVQNSRAVIDAQRVGACP